MIEEALAQLGPSRVTPAQLDTLVSHAVADQVTVSTVEVQQVDYPVGSIATGALMRCAGTADGPDGSRHSWSIFVKQLQSARVWPYLHLLPADLREQWITNFPWRIEIDVYRSRLPELLPDGLRLPVIHDVIEIDTDRAAIWMEDVQQADVGWTTERFEHAAHLLGVLAGRRPVGSDVVFGEMPAAAVPGLGIRMFAHGRIREGVGGSLAADDLWKHPALVAAMSETGETDLRAVLRAAMAHLDNWLDRMDALPQTYVHGDASPQNLLVPVDDPESFVAIDFGFNNPHCVGFDLGQLLVGLCQAQLLDPDRLPEIHRAILPAYTAGLAGTGFSASAAQVQQGYLLSLLVRSLFTAVPLELLGEPDSPALRARLVDRIRLTRFLLNLMPAVDESQAGARVAAAVS